LTNTWLPVTLALSLHRDYLMKSVAIKSHNRVGTILAAFLCLLFVSSAHAQLEDFDFSFVGAPTHSNVNGTVTGEIIGLQNNAASAPTDIIITSAPAGLDLPSLRYDLNANGWTLSGAGDTITVANGVITGADYQASLNGGSFFDLNFSITNNGVTVAELNGLEYQGTKYVANVDGLSGVTYTLVPEPSTWAMLLGGLTAMACWRSRLKRSVS
jgi:PEP-CTERM motif